MVSNSTSHTIHSSITECTYKFELSKVLRIEYFLAVADVRCSPSSSFLYLLYYF